MMARMKSMPAIDAEIERRYSTLQAVQKRQKLLTKRLLEL